MDLCPFTCPSAGEFLWDVYILFEHADKKEIKAGDLVQCPPWSSMGLAQACKQRLHVNSWEGQDCLGFLQQVAKNSAAVTESSNAGPTQSFLDRCV